MALAEKTPAIQRGCVCLCARTMGIVSFCCSSDSVIPWWSGKEGVALAFLPLYFNPFLPHISYFFLAISQAGVKASAQEMQEL